MIKKWMMRGCSWVALVVFLVGVAGCGESGGDPAVIGNGTGGGQTGSNGSATGGNEGNGGHVGGGDDNNAGGGEESFGFAPTEFLYQSGDKQLSAIKVEDIDADPPKLSHRVVYEHPYNIHSFELLRDRSGFIITADRDYTASYHTHAAYYVDADSGQPIPLIEPLETEYAVSSLRVYSALGGVGDRIWFTFHEGQVDSSGNMVAYTAPLSLDNGESMEIHPPRCNSVSRLAAEPAGERLAVHEQFCENHHDRAYVAVYDDQNFEHRVEVASQDETPFDIRIPGTLEWMTQTQLLMSLGNLDLVVIDVQGQEPPTVIGENIVSHFAFSPDRSMFVGVRDGQLLLTTFPEFEPWYLVAEDVVRRPPSW